MEDWSPKPQVRAEDATPFVLDMATTATSRHRLEDAVRSGETIPPGLALDKSGNRTEDPKAALEAMALLPLGASSEAGSHKGYGLAMMAEVLTTLLSGAIPTMLEEHRTDKHYFAAYDIAAFCDVNEFKNNMDNMLRELKNTPTVPGQNRVLYAGLPEHEEEKRRSLEGIPLHRDVVRWFAKVSRELRVPELKTL